MKNNSKSKTIENAKNKQNKGVTLIALCVTIIVLIILATASINIAIKEDGIIDTSKVVVDVYKLESYKSEINVVVLAEGVDETMNGKTEESLRDRTKKEIAKLDFVKEVENGKEDNEIRVITHEPYLIIAQINDDGSADIIYAGKYDDEPLPEIQLSIYEKSGDAVKIKASATVEKTEQTTGVSTLKLISPEKIIQNYTDGEEVIFEVTGSRKYTFEATTNIGKSIRKSIDVNEDSLIEVTLEQNSYVYDGTAKTPAVTVKKGKNVLISGTDYEVSYSNNIDVGEAQTTVKGKGSYSDINVTKTFTIEIAKTASATAINKTYTGSAQTGVTGSNVTWSGTTSSTNAGTYSATATPTANYAWSDGTYAAKTISWKINAKSVAVAWGSTTSFTYTGAAQAPTATATSGVTGETITVTRTTGTNAGSYTSTASISSVTGGQAKTSNYTLTGNTKAFTIGKANGYVNLSATSGNITYGTASKTFTVSGTHGGTLSVSDDNATAGVSIGGITVTVSSLGTLAAGTVVKVTVTSATTTNYNSASATYTLTIGRATTATASAANKTYTGSAQTGVTGTNVTWSGTYTATAVGTYTATATPTANYAWSDGTYAAKNISWSIIAPVYTITLNNQSATSAGTTAIYEKCTVGWYSNSAATTSMTKITIPSKTGYIFGGYYTATEGTGTQVIKADGTIASANSAFKANTTIYAKWQAKTVVVTFMRNTTSADTAKVTQTFTVGVENQQFASTGWNYTGYTLLGWSTDKSATVQTYSTNSSVSDGWITTNSPAITLYAIWEPISYTIKFTNGTSISASFDSYTGSTGSGGASSTKEVLPIGATVYYSTYFTGDHYCSSSGQITYDSSIIYSDGASNPNGAATVVSSKEDSFTTTTEGILTISGGCGGPTYTGSTATGAGTSSVSIKIIKIVINGVEATLE